MMFSKRHDLAIYAKSAQAFKRAVEKVSEEAKAAGEPVADAVKNFVQPTVA